jgi:thiol-disulfide isomerase/thioredoxin
MSRHDKRTALASTLLLLVSCLPAFCAEPPAALMNAAQADMKAGKYGDAIKKYKDANKKSGNSCIDCLLSMSAAYVRMGRLNDAVDAAKTAIASAQNDLDKAQAHDTLGGVLLNMGKQDTSRNKQAESELRQALALDPKLAFAHLDLGIALLRQSRDAEGISELKLFLPDAPSTSARELAQRLIDNPDRARQNYAPDFAVTTATEQTVSLQALTGKYVVLDFWATWCPPCRESVPELKDLQKRYRDRLVVLSISADKNEKAWRDFIAKKEMSWPQYRDANDKIINLFGVKAFPTYVLIDNKGVIRNVLTGLDPQRTLAARLRSEMEQLIASEVH